MESPLKRAIYATQIAGIGGPNATQGCPQCFKEAPLPGLLKIIGIVLIAVLAIFYKIPKYIYERSGGGAKGKRNVIIYFSCWAVAIIGSIIYSNVSSHIESKQIAAREATKDFESAWAKKDFNSNDIIIISRNIDKVDLNNINFLNEVEMCCYSKSQSTDKTSCETKVKILLEHGKKSDEKSSDGRTSLLTAASYGNYNIAKLLLDHKADANLAFTKNGNTPLHFAAASGNLELVKLLVESGAKKDTKNKKGQTAFDITLEEDTEVKQYLAAK
jgi:hypothetical protein